MAILDAAAAGSATGSGTAGDAGLGDGIDRLCADVASRRQLAEAAEWAELAETVVEFEEL
jgi:hypothetical protein